MAPDEGTFATLCRQILGHCFDILSIILSPCLGYSETPAFAVRRFMRLYLRFNGSDQSFDQYFKGLRSFYLEHSMIFNIQASKHGKCVREMQVCQRLAPSVAQDSFHLQMMSFWMIVQLCLLRGNNLSCIVPVTWTMVVVWSGCLIGGVVIAMWRFFRFLRIDRILLRFLFLSSFPYDVQSGEFPTKEDRRAQYRRNRLARVIERTKKQTRVGNDKGKNRKRKKPKETMSPQIGSTDIADAFAKLANIKGIPVDDKMLSRIENLGAFYIAATRCVDVSSFLATLFLYLKTEYSKSVANTAANYISELLDTEFDAQTGEFGVKSDKEKPKWLLLLKDVQENWSLVVRNEGFKKISHVLSICLALGLCDSADLDFRIGGMKMFSVGAFARHASAVDLIDATFETIVYFAEGGYACFERGSVKPLLYGNMENEEFEEAYSKCLRCHEYAKCGNLEKFEDMSENDYEALLTQCIEKARMLKTTCRGIVEKNILSRKIEVLRQWQATFRQTRVQGGLREAPYSIGVFGGTAVGKSTIANVLMVTTLLYNKYCASDDRIVTLNEADKFMSNFRSYTNGVLIDDIGNTKADFVERAPTSLMIQLVNNVRMYANMAEADMKGKVSVEPKVVIGTKNVKDTCATTYSNEPASITRRDRITLTCKVKREYAVHDMLNEDKVRAAFPGGSPLIPDFWDITVEKSFPVPHGVKGKAATVGWEVVQYQGKPLKDIGLPELIRWVGQDSTKFYASQREFVAKNNNLDKQIQLCPECRFPTPDVCICKKENHICLHKMDEHCVTGFCTRCNAHHKEEEVILDNQVGELFVATLLPRFRKWERWWRPKIAFWTNEIEEYTVDKLLERLDWLENSRWVCWTNWIPKEWIEKDWMKNVIWLTRERRVRERVRRAYCNHLLCLGICFFFIFFVNWRFLVTLIFPLWGLAGVVEYEKRRMYEEVVADNEAMPKVFKMYRDRHIKWITGVCAVVAALYAIAQIYKAFRVVPVPQGNLAPTSDNEIVERDIEVNPWAGVRVSAMPCSEKSKTTTPDRLEKMVQDNLCHMAITLTDNGKMRNFECDAFFPKSNVAIVPRHMWKTDDIKAKFTRHDPSSIGGNFECFLYRRYSVDIPKTDLSVVWVPNGGDWKDLTDYFPLERFANVPARLTYKQRDGACVGSKLMMEVGNVVTYAAEFFGAKYNLRFETFEGLCMAPLITETKGPLIGGFHLGGKNGQTRGCSGLMLQREFDDAFEKLRCVPGVLLSKSSGVIPKELYDIQFFENDEIHPKSPINFLPEGANCKYYGQVKGRASYYSDVVPTVISQHVEDVCGVPQKWGGPKFRKGYPWQASLQFSAKPSCGIEGSLLDRASSDYLSGFLKTLDDFPKLRARIIPLTDMETVCGVDGLRFIDKMPPSTSVGYPLTGPKSNFLTLLDPMDHPTHQCPAELDQRFWDHAREMEELYLAGERAYPIFKACLKDEPTKLTKDKVRVFQGAPIALQLLVRKYYLPVARVLSMLPFASECAVGINAQGPEWDQLANWVARYGEDRILAGDYSKYDLRMPAQVMFVAFRILMDIAEDCGYSEDDLIIMEGIATDICYPLMAYNGDLIQHFGSNPSGQNLTVYINSIVNALLFRCAYYHIYSDRKDVPEFRDVCSLITYGDDAKSSVHADYPEFNHIAVANFLEERDMKFTMPDKESEPTPYMKDEEADLLKRANVYSEDTGMIMGALDEDSIFKSLHSVLKSKAMTREQQAMQNIDGALREWFPHGREVYEMRREQMKEVARRADITHGCSVIHETYEDRLSQWKDKYE